MTIAEKISGVTLFGLLMVVGLSYWGDSRSSESKAMSDSLRATAPAFHDSTRAIAHRETVYVEKASKHGTRASLAQARAEGFQRAADSIAQLTATLTTASDSAETWKSAYDARTIEADSLRLAATEFEHAFSAERDARMLADRRADAEAARRESFERLAGSLEQDLARANRRRWVDRIIGGAVGYGVASASLNSLTAPDREWERLQQRHPALQQLDNQSWKTWLWHGALTYAGGEAIAAFTPLSARQGRWTMAAFYVLREAHGVIAQGNRNYLDVAGDVGVPLLVARVRF